MFDLEGNLVTLDQLFAPDSRYLDQLSAAAYPKVVAELAQRAGSTPTPDMLDTVRMGTAPTPEALQFFYLYQGDLHLLFPPYQVASYAAGSFDIAIPLSELSDILKK
ncbi:MAG TPA: RsiV family protein [Candidatus Paceibacterota bacterium]